MGMKDWFRRLSEKVAHWAGSPITFAACSLIVLIWAFTGPEFHYSDTWQLIINTGTTVITFLMVFLIQNTQNRDSRAIHLKLDELIRATSAARNKMINLQDLSDEELDQLHNDLCKARQVTETQISEVQERKRRRGKRHSHHHVAPKPANPGD